MKGSCYAKGKCIRKDGIAIMTLYEILQDFLPWPYNHTLGWLLQSDLEERNLRNVSIFL